MSIVKRIKKFIIRLVVLVRKKIRELEGKLDEMQPHPVVGVFIVILGILISLLGVAMLFLPGPGTVTLAIGIAAIVMGAKTVKGSYGPQRVERERARKHERLARMRAKRAQKKAEHVEQRAERKAEHEAVRAERKAAKVPVAIPIPTNKR